MTPLKAEDLQIWAVWPSAHHERANDCASLWKLRGYKTAVLVDRRTKRPNVPDFVLQPAAQWRGFPHAVNLLMRDVQADVYVVIGDDIRPAPQERIELARRFLAEFPSLCGVAQPTGDRYGLIDICAISPWVGRAFVKKMRGKVYHEGYYHYFSDAELCAVATRMGCYRCWPDVTQYHAHWGRDVHAEAPPHLARAQLMWRRDRAVFQRREPEVAKTCC